MSAEEPQVVEEPSSPTIDDFSTSEDTVVKDEEESIQFASDKGVVSLESSGESEEELQ